ncbi:MAG: hypothetical protein HZB17_08240 [Chloroflexi bacterium]|nr:hypothetical protein [Chloroflexota bacterium]
MNEHVTEINLVVRKWDKKAGLDEHAHTYNTIDDFFAACLKVENPELIERLIINGMDSAGKERTMTFVFQSVTVDAKK